MGRISSNTALITGGAGFLGSHLGDRRAPGGTEVIVDSHCAGFPEPVNVDNPAKLTMWELAELVLAMTGSRSKLVRTLLSVDNPKQRWPDSAAATSEVGWEPTIALANGLEPTIADFRQPFAT